MKIIADEKIPLIEHYFGGKHQLILKNGRELKREDVFDADLLIVRSVTRVDQSLLQGTKVQFVGSVTSGADHLDIAWLNEAGIHYFVAEGCNTTAVVEYVMAVIAALQKQKLLLQKKPRTAVIGVGKIGSKVVEMLQTFDFEVLQCDPLRAQVEPDFPHVPLEALVDLDFISIHTPLTKHGPFPTFHLINRDFFERQKKTYCLLNVGRGGVVNGDDLLKSADHCIACLDVWENEPTIDRALVERVLVATPHIAGHSIQSKYRAIQMVYEAARQLDLVAPNAPPVEFPRKIISFNHQKVDWRDVVLRVYDPRKTTLFMKENSAFDTLRNRFNKNEFQFVQVLQGLMHASDKSTLKKLGFLSFTQDN